MPQVRLSSKRLTVSRLPLLIFLISGFSAVLGYAVPGYAEPLALRASSERQPSGHHFNRVEQARTKYKDSVDSQRLSSANYTAESAKVVMTATNVIPTIWDAELSTLQNRLGDVRRDPLHQNGGWGKVIANRYNVSNNDIDYQQNMSGMVFGSDATLRQADGNLLIGAMLSYSSSDIDHTYNGEGDVDSYSVGFYTTYMADNGLYVDGVIKVNYFKSNVLVASAENAEGQRNSSGVGFSLETGKTMESNALFIEPYVQVSGFSGESGSYSLSEQMQADVASTNSLKGEVGSTFGKSFQLSEGTVLKPYGRLAMSKEFNQNNALMINQTEEINNDMSDTVSKYGAGMNLELNNSFATYAEITYSRGDKVESPYSGYLGARYSF